MSHVISIFVNNIILLSIYVEQNIIKEGVYRNNIQCSIIVFINL